MSPWNTGLLALCWLFLGVQLASARPSFSQFWLSSDVEVRVPDNIGIGFTVPDRRSTIVMDPDGTGDAQVSGALSEEFGANLDALDRFPTVFSIDVTREINGVNIEPADAFFAAGLTPPIIFLDADVAGVPEGVNLDALTKNPASGNLVVSFDRTYSHPALGLITPRHLIEISEGQLDIVVFDGMDVPRNANLDGAHWATDEFMLLSFDIDVELPSGGSPTLFRDDDILLYDRLSGDFDLLFSLSGSSHSSWIAADLDAIWAERLVETGALRFSLPYRELPEAAGEVDVIIERVGGVDTHVQARVFPINDTATAGNDYDFTGTTLIWEDGDASSRTVSLTIVDDNVEEENPERFRLELTVESGAAALGTPSKLLIHVLDDDGENLFSTGFDS